ncbi:mechanosensitive ion channel domain-containing protein [Arenimonas daejeonensis]|uniref:mechanosensitive ion channel domain-containing protein n=1 Tax=Arenimonas daejeonensis TaxID=370777 RepID=UPI0011BE9493|nr:mechanosensitive ion channel domain-containing protein [Arenimonas daejeonensis]
MQSQLAVDTREALQVWRSMLPANADIETLERLLEQERTTASQLRDRIDVLTSELSATIAQGTAGQLSQGERQRRIDELAVPVVPGDGEPAALTTARQARNTAERRRLVAEQALWQAEQDVAGTRQALQDLELRDLRNRLSMHEPRLATLRALIAERGRRELEALTARLTQQAEAATPDAVTSKVARENLALGEELLATNQRLNDQRRAQAAQEQALERDLAGVRDSQTRVDLGGRSEQVGIWLWAELRRLEPEARIRRQLDSVRQTEAELRLRLIGLADFKRDLADLPAAARVLRENALGREDAAAPAAEATGEDPLESLLSERVDLVYRLEPMIWRLIAACEQSGRRLQSRLDANRELRQTLNRHLLWIRSHPPVDLAWLAQVPAGAYDLVNPSRLATSGQQLLHSIRERPWAHAGAVLVLAALLVLRRRAPVRLGILAQAIRDARADRYRRTLESLAWTVVAALPAAMALLMFGGLLQSVGAGKYSDSLGQALIALALPVFTLGFLRWLVRERGLAHAHFRWTRPRREALQLWVPRLQWLLLPAYFVMLLAFIRNQDLAVNVHARIAVTFASISGAWAIWQLLAPGRLWHTRAGDDTGSRARRLLRATVPLFLAVCAVLALEGYVYSAAILVDSVFSSVGVITVVAVVNGMLSRWFVLGERRLALRRLQQRREAEAQAGEGPAETSGEAVPVELDEEITLEQVNTHSRSLLRALKLTLLAIGLGWVWADVLPAIARFDEIALWSITETGADGANVLVPVTLVAVMVGVLVLALTFVAARNLPGLIEIALMSRGGIDAASRYAITSVSRYAIVVIGVIAGLGLLGLRWGQLQWMAAALTVGLGFGLQEIFANFVSGLILLFERPFRVGDTITVNNLDGTVTRIRTRATTILDFDNKEIVVPNKVFITGQLVNWTLSDETTRVTIKMGVDYGTDPALVHRLLLQAAEENPRVLTDWPPRSWLLGFGASTMDFELRVFVGSMNDRLHVSNEINARLVELFAENGIAFAYPQLDVHVRELPEPRRPQDPREPEPTKPGA